MATTYIKLGPIGDAFSSKELGLYLNSNNASEIDKSILDNRLSKFVLTGFVVEISKLEYDNIKLLNSITTNIPLNAAPVSQPNILEPVEDVVNTAPPDVSGKRYLIANPLPGIFLSKKDLIAIGDGIDWSYDKPLDGMILPVYEMGISLHYSGTYPSGSWDIPQSKLDELSGTTSTDNSDIIALFTELFNTEAQQRKTGDSNLNTRIDNLPNSTPFSGKAADVSIADVSELYTSNNVEGALEQAGTRYNAQQTSIGSLQALITSLISEGMGFSFTYGPTDPVDGLLNNLYLNTESQTLWRKNGTDDDDAAWVNIFDFTLINIKLKSFVKVYPIGTATPIIIDTTVEPFSLLGKIPQVLIFEDLGGNVYKKREGILYTYGYDSLITDLDDLPNLINITITPDDGGSGTIDPLVIIFKQ